MNVVIFESLTEAFEKLRSAIGATTGDIQAFVRSCPDPTRRIIASQRRRRHA